jgi:excisionase family DNA binding protein
VVALTADWVGVAVSAKPPLLGASISGSSAWVIYQLLREPLKIRVRQLQCDPNVHADVVRDLVATAAAIREAARQYRELVTDSVEAPASLSSADLGNPPGRWGVAETAARLNCSPRWVTALISQGRLAAVKAGREWRVDVDSIVDYQRRGVSSAA